MTRRGSEPEEALGPAIDGLDRLGEIEGGKAELPEPELPSLMDEAREADLEPDEAEEAPVVLIFGAGPHAEAVARLAAACGFGVQLARHEASGDGDAGFPDASEVHIVPDFLDIVDTCSIDRNFFVCVFADDPEDCEIIMAQCLASPASYLGLMANRESRDKIFTMLKADGAPDAELAAVACPMGLSIGAETPEQAAVGIVAELLAARAGTLKRLRHEDQAFTG